MDNIIENGGLKIIQTSEYIEVNGEKIILPDKVKNVKKQTVSENFLPDTISQYTPSIPIRLNGNGQIAPKYLRIILLMIATWVFKKLVVIWIGVGCKKN